MSCRKHIFGLGLLAVMAAAAPAYAQPGATPNFAADYPVCNSSKATDSDGARQKYIAARQDYEEGSYDSALRRFKDSYANDCTKPEVLLLVSSTYERKGDRPAALAALETYVQRAGKDAPDLATTQAKIENLKKQIASQPPPPATTTQTTQTTTPEGEHSVAPWIVVGVGGAVLVTGVILFVASPLPDGCSFGSQQCSKVNNESDAQLTDAKSKAGNAFGREVAGIVMMGGGALAVAGGLVWHFVEPTGPKEKAASLTPSISPTFAGLSFDAKF